MSLLFLRRATKLRSGKINFSVLLNASALSIFAFSIIAGSALAPVHAQTPANMQRLALSEIPDSDQDKAANPAMVPLPGPLREVPTESYKAPESDATERDITRPHVTNDGKVPEVLYDYSKLPQAVQDTRNKILDIAKAGKIDALKPLLGDGGETSPLISLGEYDGTPLDYLKTLSGDTNGQELLAILVDLLESGYVHLDAGTPSEVYVWPYFFAYPLDKLDDRQMVELYQIITAGDFEEMKGVGAYIFYRIGIAPDGSWKFFVAGD